MIFRETNLAGAYVIEPEKMSDERGHFARVWCETEFREHGLSTDIAQLSVSYNKKKGTLRGLHFALPPYKETKLVRCSSGAIFDVIVDIRPESPTFSDWVGETLTSGNGRMFFIPNGFAHGFITLENDTEVTYQISDFFQPAAGCGIPYDDPDVGVEWPVNMEVISSKDLQWSNLSSLSLLENFSK